MERFGYHHDPYLMPSNPSLPHFPAEIAHLAPEQGYVNPHPFHLPNSNRPNDPQNRHYYYHMPHLNLESRKIPVTGPAPPPRRFLVVDRSGGGNTTLFYAAAHPPVRFRPTWDLNHLPTDHSGGAEERSRYPKEEETEEDTEEIDALLCSEYDSSDDDVASTGHSPSDVTTEEEEGPPGDPPTGEMGRPGFVGSSTAAKKRRRRAGPVLEEDEAESGCDGSRREKVRRALEALRRVVPGTGREDGLAVIEGAIEYLRWMKVEMEATGLDAP